MMIALWLLGFTKKSSIYTSYLFLLILYLSDFQQSESCNLKFHDCFYCICQSCQIDIVFLIDQSQNSEPKCGSNKVAHFGVMNDLLGVDEFDYPGMMRKS